MREVYYDLDKRVNVLYKELDTLLFIPRYSGYVGYIPVATFQDPATQEYRQMQVFNAPLAPKININEQEF